MVPMYQRDGDRVFIAMRILLAQINEPNNSPFNESTNASNVSDADVANSFSLADRILAYDEQHPAPLSKACREAEEEARERHAATLASVWLEALKEGVTHMVPIADALQGIALAGTFNKPSDTEPPTADSVMADFRRGVK